MLGRRWMPERTASGLRSAGRSLRHGGGACIFAEIHAEVVQTLAWFARSLCLPCLMADGAAASMHTVFSAECNPIFDWHSVALFHSHAQSGQPGGITRLLA